MLKEERDLILCCDNYGGQSENQVMTDYLTYLVKVEKFLQECKVYFMQTY